MYKTILHTNKINIDLIDGRYYGVTLNDTDNYMSFTQAEADEIAKALTERKEDTCWKTE